MRTALLLTSLLPLGSAMPAGWMSNSLEEVSDDGAASAGNGLGGTPPAGAQGSQGAGNLQTTGPLAGNSVEEGASSGSQPSGTGTQSPSNGSKTTPGGSGDGSDSNYIEVTLKLHNDKRAMHGAAPLEWDDKLADMARAHKYRCEMEHDAQERGVGQNLYMSSYSGGEAAQMEGAMKGWYDEEEPLYNYGGGDFSMATGHFTQVVWKATTKVGCAMYGGCRDGGKMTVCNYSPPGK